ncbi:hypothetical protein [Jeotgalibacillus marinus]|uniref:Lipoprotein n=1 Tax=Jeotgalibacillus marinus TaxID=86667 RepID=A0ABV3Q4L7_9BACL
MKKTYRIKCLLVVFLVGCGDGTSTDLNKRNTTKMANWVTLNLIYQTIGRYFFKRYYKLSGETTLLSLAGALDIPKDGMIHFDGQGIETIGLNV